MNNEEKIISMLELLIKITHDTHDTMKQVNQDKSFDERIRILEEKFVKMKEKL